MQESRLSDEQIKAVEHFNARSGYWQRLYFDQRAYAGYTHYKQHRFVVDFVEDRQARLE